MNKTLILIVGVVIVLLVGGFLVISSMQSNGPTGNSIATNGSKIKFSDIRGAANAFLISGDSLDSNTKAALSGFQYNQSVQSDGSAVITLKAINSEYTDQVYTVLPGEKLYFIENSMADDSPHNGDYSPGDDRAVLVDTNGYVVN